MSQQIINESIARLKFIFEDQGQSDSIELKNCIFTLDQILFIENR